jgi:uncharacterized protein (TIGR03905 family)
MMHYKYRPIGVCPFNLEFDIDETSHVTNIHFDGGCNGNLKAVGKLCEGMTAAEVAGELAGNTCGFEDTSCADQLSRAVLMADSELTK